ncbi:LPD7 domain-containing protein [Rhizorhapis suberifaciens]|uniref:Large polyvalent protein-associated domain-containing protein n=1 Tax=Rhizorhapis suberifaciens TaxID=13656 RepID=A0A840HYP2_9SPHN|nr:LPD7 domain-containing protein [Rhizorhapis suberifaciens]MBB4642628.1 hypothetical protein [Rhizorhapis suberifaciens]
MTENLNPPDPREEAPRKRPGVEMPEELESRFLRVGNKLYRSAHDKTPVATISHDRIKARDASALPDLVRLAKANGWTSLKINGDADFKRAAYLAAAAQGITIEGYKPDAKTRAAAKRDQARQPRSTAARTQTRQADDVEKRQRTPRTPNQVRDNKEKPDLRLDLAERFRRQSHSENAKDPDLRRAQSHVAHAITIASSRFPQNSERQKAFVDRRKEEVAGRIGRGERIAGVRILQQQDERIIEMQQTQILQYQRSPSGR